MLSDASTPWRFSISDSTGPIAGPDAPKPMMSTVSFLPCGSVQKPPSFLNPLPDSSASPFFGSNASVSYFANRSLTASKYGCSGG